ncbi:Mu-like prophage major head subunit gpT family protein [Horticoccus sp. 23ND18S-11]|uniref:Mu-like prophage major head subunit gpT family protein n=1 Tax=Horticoccus sp. 23ND18S-11 TaxID=3391832 RepID=UPI0039C8C9C3
MIITAASLTSANKGFRKLYTGGLASVGKQRITEYAFRAPSQSKDETYGWLGALPGMRKLVGDVNIRNMVEHGFAVANEEFEVTVAVKRAELERDRLSIYTGFFTAMGQSAGRHPDKLLAAAMVGGFTKRCYTGKFFFDANHEPQAGKTKFSNKGTKKLSAANFVTAVESILSRKDAEGEPINDNPMLVLTVSPKWQETAEKILVATTINNETNVNKGKARLDVWNRLSGAATEDMWFLHDEGAVVKPYVHQVEVETEYKHIDDPNGERVMLKQEYLHQAYGRYAVAALVPELAYGSTGVDAA